MIRKTITPAIICLLLALSIFTDMSAQTTRLPYFNGFELQQDTVGWMFKKRAHKTGFEVGTATHCLGYKSMYISPDSGQTASYATTSSGYVSLAYKSFTLPEGTYQLAFDYQLGGDGTNQDMKVAWTYDTITLNASALGSYPNAITQHQFTDTTGRNTFGFSAWTHVTGTVTVPTGGGTYNLCFAFRSNSTTILAPGACIDNIQLNTVKSDTDCTAVPTNIQVTKDPQAGVIITWHGNATEYEVVAASASDPQEYSICRHTGITDTTDTMRYSELTEGQYFFYVRAICGADTSLYSETSGVFIYDLSLHCIDFITLDTPTTQCTYGTYSNPYQTNGCINNGPSEMSSRHTVHTDLSETDERTNNALRTVPTGEIASVRLGNWNDGSEGEAITYTYNVPAGSALILMMKYAIVFEAPGHDEDQEFLLEIMNTNNVLLDSTCTKANFKCHTSMSQAGWHSNSCSGYNTIWWKEWTTIGVNLTQYAGQTIRIRLTTKDCNWAGHFGYAYFTLGCQDAELTETYNEGTTEFKAPDGFIYSWRNKCTSEEVSTEQTFSIDYPDSCTYTCTCTFKENAACTYTLTAYSKYRMVATQMNYSNRGTVTGGGLYLIGDTATLTATPYQDYIFTHWSTGDTTRTMSFVVTNDTTLTAFFEPIGNSEGTDVNEVEDLHITLTPNPINAGETVLIYGDFDGATSVEIYNSFGQVVAAFKPESYPIEISGITVSGLYYVRFITETGQVNIRKLIVK